MKKKIILISFLTLFLLSLILVSIFYLNEAFVTCMIFGIISIIIGTIFFFLFFLFKSDRSMYKEKLNLILNEYKNDLVKSSTMPSLDGKKVVIVGSIEELMETQKIFRKPVYYKTESECCAFFLLESSEACVYILKVNAGVISNLETIMNDLNRKSHEYSIFSEIDKNAIIRLESSRVFKFSSESGMILPEEDMLENKDNIEEEII